MAILSAMLVVRFFCLTPLDFMFFLDPVQEISSTSHTWTMGAHSAHRMLDCLSFFIVSNFHSIECFVFDR